VALKERIEGFVDLCGEGKHDEAKSLWAQLSVAPKASLGTFFEIIIVFNLFILCYFCLLRGLCVEVFLFE
jgi:hypothetical protein